MENEAVPPLLQSAHGTFLPKILRGSQMSPKAPLDTRLETADFQRPDGGIPHPSLVRASAWYAATSGRGKA